MPTERHRWGCSKQGSLEAPEPLSRFIECSSLPILSRALLQTLDGWWKVREQSPKGGGVFEDFSSVPFQHMATPERKQFRLGKSGQLVRSQGQSVWQMKSLLGSTRVCVTATAAVPLLGLQSSSLLIIMKVAENGSVLGFLLPTWATWTESLTAAQTIPAFQAFRKETAGRSSCAFIPSLSLLPLFSIPSHSLS